MQIPVYVLLRNLLSALALSLVAACMGTPAGPSSGTADIPDPYRWLEAPVDSTRVSTWLVHQAQKTRQWQQQQPSYTRIQAQLRAAWDHPKWMVASIQDGQVFFYYNAGLDEHYSLYVQPLSNFLDDRERLLPPTGSARLLIDGHAYTGDTSPGAISISPDANWLAFQINSRTASGNPESLWYLQSLRVPSASPQLLSVSHQDWTLPAERLAWGRDAGQVYFTVSVPMDTANWQARVYAQALDTESPTPRQIHAVATGFSVQQLHVLDSSPEPRRQGGIEVPAGHNLLLATASATDSDLRWCLLDTEPATLAGGRQTHCQRLMTGPRAGRFVGAIEGKPAFITVTGRGTGGVTLAGKEQRIEIIAETDAPLHSALVVGQTLVLEYLVHGSSTLRLTDLQGRAIRDDLMPLLPTPVSIEGLRTTDAHKLLIAYSGILTPPRSVLVDLQSGRQTLLTQDRPDLSLDGLHARLEQVRSGNVRVPVWVTGSGVGQGQLPARMLLDVYGGFAAPMDTSFSISRLVWMINGGGYAVAGPRGGGDYGERWHQAGRGSNRHHSIADVLAVAKWLRSRQSTSQGRLAVSGRSHGGLLATEAVHEAPRLFSALVTEAAVFDLMRLDALGGASFWHQEYDGTKASPYRTLLANTGVLADHPPALLITRDNDAVVAPAHSFKYLQALQANSADVCNAALLAVFSGQEHQPDGRIEQLVDDYALRWTFLNSHLSIGKPPH